MAYAFFLDNYILPKDITNYILLFLTYSDDDVHFYKYVVIDNMVRNIKYQYDLYNDVMNEPRWSRYSLYWSSFPRFFLRIKDDNILNIKN